MPARRGVRIGLAAGVAALALGVAPATVHAGACEPAAPDAACVQVAAVPEGLVAAPSLHATSHVESRSHAQTTAASVAAVVSAAVLFALAIAVLRPLQQ